MKNKNMWMIAIILAVIAAGAGFFGGMQYQKSLRAQASRQFGTGVPGGANRTRAGGNFRPVSGEVIKSDDKSITVKLTDGSSKIILLSDKTTISKSTEATIAAIAVGEKVAVFGTDNSDGSVTAQNVQINPRQGMMGDRQPVN